jgi:hypothetical protein
MVGNVSTERASRALEFGMYRDGDNNLDEVQALTIAQALDTSKNDRRIEFTVEDTTARRGFAPENELRTESYTIADGMVSKDVDVSAPRDMSARSELTAFVAHVLDNSEKAGAKATWIDLIDHGGGDGGGLQSDHGLAHIMRADDMAGAIADGVARHAKEHPEDAGRKIDGVVANQCLMATVAFSSALSHAGVAYLAASPETMLAPGVPSGVAHDIASHPDDPAAMAKALTDTTMDKTYGPRHGGFAPGRGLRRDRPRSQKDGRRRIVDQGTRCGTREGCGGSARARGDSCGRPRDRRHGSLPGRRQTTVARRSPGDRTLSNLLRR